MITQEQVTKIAEEYHGPGFELYGITHGIPDNCAIYRTGDWNPDQVWCVLCNAHPGELMLASSRAIIICKDTGKIIYDGSANDEG